MYSIYDYCHWDETTSEENRARMLRIARGTMTDADRAREVANVLLSAIEDQSYVWNALRDSTILSTDLQAYGRHVCTAYDGDIIDRAAALVCSALQAWERARVGRLTRFYIQDLERTGRLSWIMSDFLILEVNELRDLMTRDGVTLDRFGVDSSEVLRAAGDALRTRGIGWVIENFYA